MQNEKLVHDLIVDYCRQRFSRDYKEVTVNPGGDPDIVLGNHGLTLARVEVETESTITPLKAEQWKQLAVPGMKLILMVPKHSKVRVTELLWQAGIAGNVGVGSYEIALTVP